MTWGQSLSLSGPASQIGCPVFQMGWCWREAPSSSASVKDEGPEATFSLLPICSDSSPLWFFQASYSPEPFLAASVTLPSQISPRGPRAWPRARPVTRRALPHPGGFPGHPFLRARFLQDSWASLL